MVHDIRQTRMAQVGQPPGFITELLDTIWRGIRNLLDRDWRIQADIPGRIDQLLATLAEYIADTISIINDLVSGKGHPDLSAYGKDQMEKSE
jgi:hypothetical protein